MNKFDFGITPFDSNKQLRKRFNSLDANEIVKHYTRSTVKGLEEEGFKKALKLFREVSQRVPAYKNFLKKNKIDPKKVRTKFDFDKVPLTDKENYIRAYPLKELVWDGNLEKYYIMSSSSGSTGNPFFWPRGAFQEIEGAIQSELIYNFFYDIKGKSTLYVIGFAMGTWIAGPYMLAATELVSQKNSNIIVVTPGTDKELFIKLVKNLAPNFERIILAGYPPIIKDIVDQASDFGLNWKRYNVKTFFAGENFTESYREHILKKLGSKNPYLDCISVYGSADAAILAHETPISTLVRKIASDNEKVAEYLFNEKLVPSLGQYHPTLKYFQISGVKILFSTYSGIPLVRYAIGDRGGLIDSDEMSNKLIAQGIDLKSEIKRHNLEKYNWNLPFVYLFGRTDLTVIFYGANIYPENIKPVLDSKNWSNILSGKFLMSVEEDRKKDKEIHIKVELAKNVSSTEKISEKLQKDIFESLKRLNSEYNIIFRSIGNQAIPKVELVEYGSFQVGIKHKWTRRN